MNESAKARGRARVAVLILVYNGMRWLAQCLPSVTGSLYSDFETVVVDNGSSDGSSAYVAVEYPNVRLIRFDLNLGYARAYNEAVRRINAEYIVLLNQDTKVMTETWLTDLVKSLEKGADIAAATCKMVSLQNPLIIDSVGGAGLPNWMGFMDIGKYEADLGQFSSDFEPFSFCGGAAMLRRSLFLETGGFDDRYFLYCEDVDLSWRYRLRGYRICYVPNAVVGHYFSGSVEGEDGEAKKLYLCHRNLLRTILKNCGYSVWWAVRCYLLYSFVLLLAFCFVSRRKWLAIVKALFWNTINLGDTYRMRGEVQRTRKVAEGVILDMMFPPAMPKRIILNAAATRILQAVFGRAPRASEVAVKECASLTSMEG